MVEWNWNTKGNPHVQVTTKTQKRKCLPQEVWLRNIWEHIHWMVEIGKKMFNIQQQIVTYGFNERLVEEEAKIKNQIEELDRQEEWL